MVIAAVIFAAVLTVHHFGQLADRGLYLAIDDSLANVSVGLSKLGRYGMFSMPLQWGAPDAPVRTHGFYNYGPAPFLLGAALDWLFGTSYAVQRFLHPLVLIALSFLILAVLRPLSAGAGALFAILITFVFWRYHWPMARPDIVVSLFTGLGLMALTYAMQTNGPTAWASAAFCIATAVTTHQIAWPLVPAMALVWLVAQLQAAADQTARARALGSFAACLGGGLLAFLLYAVAIEFRFRDLFELYGWYAGILPRERGQKSWMQVYSGHYLSAHQIGLVWFAQASAAALLVTATRLCSDQRRRIIALLLPSAALGLAYEIWLGFYSNQHACRHCHVEE